MNPLLPVAPSPCPLLRWGRGWPKAGVRGWFEGTMGELFPGILSLVQRWPESYRAPTGSNVPPSCGG
jgi:hypothetical protein